MNQPASNQQQVHPDLQKALELLNQKNFAEAHKLLTGYTRVHPDDPFGWDNLGLTLRNMGQHAQTKAAFAKAVELRPKNPIFLDHLAIASRAVGDREEAIEHYKKALKIAPNRGATWGNLGNVQRDLNLFADAVHSYSRAVELLPDSVSMRLNLAAALIGAEKPKQAMEHIHKAVAMEPNNPKIYTELGNAYLKLDDHEQAIAAYRKSIDLDGNQHGLYHNMATAYQQHGDLEAAEEAYRKALEIQPNFGPSRRQLGSITKFDANTADLEELEKMAGDDGLDESQRADIYFTLAKAHDDLKQYASAFAFLQSANQIVRKEIDYKSNANTMFVDRIVKIYDSAFFESHQGYGIDSKVPIFILGMPRSGTTLVEQIISSHPQVYGAGELMKLHDLTTNLKKRFGTEAPYPENMPELTPEQTKQVAQDYVDFLLKFDHDAPHVTDKMPFNFRMLGLIATLFPNAKVVHCRRHPYDIILSCYFARFKEQLAFSYNLLEAGRYVRDYERMMDHWRRVLPIPVYEARYDLLVSDQEAESRKLIEFCDLEWDEACLRFHENKRPVLTASNWQVRQPMYKSSVERWRNYTSELAPLRTVLGPAEVVYP